MHCWCIMQISCQHIILPLESRGQIATTTWKRRGVGVGQRHMADETWRRERSNCFNFRADLIFLQPINFNPPTSMYISVGSRVRSVYAGQMKHRSLLVELWRLSAAHRGRGYSQHTDVRSGQDEENVVSLRRSPSNSLYRLLTDRKWSECAFVSYKL
jgi:hypothetical protein